MTTAIAPANATAAGLPSVGLTKDAQHRYFLDGKGPIPSVTTVLGVAVAKPALVGWARRETALYAVRNLELLDRMVKDRDQEAAAEYLKGITTSDARRKADIGVRVHALAEAVIRRQVAIPSEEEQPYIAGLTKFLDQWEPKWLAAEEMVCSTKYGYAGTLDEIGVIGNETWLCDVKTGAGVYPEHALQLSAYANAEFFGRPGVAKRYRLPKIDRYGILHVRPEGTELIPLSVTAETFVAFRGALALYRWSQGDVVGVPWKGNFSERGITTSKALELKVGEWMPKKDDRE